MLLAQLTLKYIINLLLVSVINHLLSVTSKNVIENRILWNLSFNPLISEQKTSTNAKFDISFG